MNENATSLFHGSGEVDLQKWLRLCTRKGIVNTPLQKFIVLDPNQPIPILFSDLWNYFVANGGLEVENIFSASAPREAVQKSLLYIDAFLPNEKIPVTNILDSIKSSAEFENSTNQLKNSIYNPTKEIYTSKQKEKTANLAHLVAHLLKCFLQNLPSQLLSEAVGIVAPPNGILPELSDAAMLSAVLDSMNFQRKCVFRWLLKACALIAQNCNKNKMNAKALSSVLSPIVLRADFGMSNLHIDKSAVALRSKNITTAMHQMIRAQIATIKHISFHDIDNKKQLHTNSIPINASITARKMLQNVASNDTLSKINNVTKPVTITSEKVPKFVEPLLDYSAPTFESDATSKGIAAANKSQREDESTVVQIPNSSQLQTSNEHVKLNKVKKSDSPKSLSTKSLSPKSLSTRALDRVVKKAEAVRISSRHEKDTTETTVYPILKATKIVNQVQNNGTKANTAAQAIAKPTTNTPLPEQKRRGKSSIDQNIMAAEVSSSSVQNIDTKPIAQTYCGPVHNLAFASNGNQMEAEHKLSPKIAGQGVESKLKRDKGKEVKKIYNVSVISSTTPLNNTEKSSQLAQTLCVDDPPTYAAVKMDKATHKKVTDDEKTLPDVTSTRIAPLHTVGETRESQKTKTDVSNDRWSSALLDILSHLDEIEKKINLVLKAVNTIENVLKAAENGDVSAIKKRSFNVTSLTVMHGKVTNLIEEKDSVTTEKICIQSEKDKATRKRKDLHAKCYALQEKIEMLVETYKEKK